MKRKTRLAAVAVLLSSSVMFSSCIGSFSLFNKLKTWNHSVGDKWINEVVFFALWIVPAYEIAMLVDVLVLNTIEFWTGDNPASAEVKTIENEDGIFTVYTDENGHKIQQEGSDDIVEFRFDKEEQSWSLVIADEIMPLFKMINQEQGMLYMADGSTMTFDANQAGVYALRQVLEQKAFYAFK